MKKITISLLIIVIFVFTMSACSKTNGNDDIDKKLINELKEENQELRSELQVAKSQIKAYEIITEELRETIKSTSRYDKAQNNTDNKNRENFTLSDLTLKKQAKPITEKTYQDIMNEFGKPLEVKKYTKSISDGNKYYHTCIIYEDIQFLFLTPENNVGDDELVFKFYIKSDKYSLVNNIACGMSIKDLSNIYSGEVMNITVDKNEKHWAYLRKKIMKMASDSDYDEIFYLKGEVTEDEYEKYKSGTAAIGIIFLVKNDKVKGITNIYPTAN